MTSPPIETPFRITVMGAERAKRWAADLQEANGDWLAASGAHLKLAGKWRRRGIAVSALQLAAGIAVVVAYRHERWLLCAVCLAVLMLLSAVHGHTERRWSDAMCEAARANGKLSGIGYAMDAWVRSADA